MTNTQIEAFLVLCKCGNISTAAEKLFISQPALSRTIKTLEKELGYPLFVRSKGVRRVTLTVEGELFYTIAMEFDHLYTQAGSLSKRELRQSFQISAASAFTTSFLPYTCEVFQKNNPNVDLAVDTMHSTDSFIRLQERRVDMAFVTTRFVETDVESTPLFREKVVLLCSKGMFPEGPIHTEQLDRTSAVTTEWNPEFQAWSEYWLGKNFKAPRLRVKVGEYVQLFANGKKFWALLPLTSAKSNAPYGEYELHDVYEEPPDRICYAIYRRESFGELHRAMLDAARESVRLMPDITPM